MCQEYHCESSYLPLMPPEDADDDERDEADIAGVTVLMLFASALTACPCNPESSLNEEIQ